MPFHCISGLPRSGSTLLAALLAQNSSFYTGISSPCLSLARNLIALTGSGEMAALVNAEQKRAMVRATVESFYACVRGGADVIVDTNRQWTANLPLLVDLFPEARVVCCVRDIAWIIDSIERLLRANVYEQTKLFQPGPERATVYGRADALMKTDRLIGGPWTALREGFYSDFGDRLLVIEYDLLARQPAEVLRIVYDFLGEPSFDGHDFETVTFDAPEFDEAIGVRDLHKVRPKVEPQPRRTVLPADLFNKYREHAFWRDPLGSAARVLQARPPGPKEVTEA